MRFSNGYVVTAGFREKQLAQVGTLFTPDTILRRYCELVAKKWDYSDRKECRPGRPRIRQVIVDLIGEFAKENRTCR